MHAGGRAVFNGGIAPLVASKSGSLSPDGTRLAFTAQDAGGRVLLWMRLLDQIEPRPLAGTDGATYPFWSPDSRSIGYFTDSGIYRVEATGGTPQLVTNVRLGRGGTWNDAGDILFAKDGWTGIDAVSTTSGTVRPVILSNAGGPAFLPDGRHFLYRSSDGGIHVAALDGDAPAQRLLAADSRALYAAPGFLVFNRQGTVRPAVRCRVAAADG